MNDVKRYDIIEVGGLAESADGYWVKYDDHKAKCEDLYGMYRLALLRETEWERNITDEEYAAFDAELVLGNNPRLVLKKFLVRRKEAAYASGGAALSAQHAEGRA